MNCEVARNRAKFWTVFALTNSKGGSPPKKLYPRYHARTAARRVEKFREVHPPVPRVIAAKTPTFKPIFECSLLKIVGGT